MLLRPATAADIPAMIALEKHSVTAAHWTLRLYEAVFTPPARITLVIEDGDKFCGFLIGRAVSDEWELENIAVDGTARRRGLGTRLLGEFLDAARAAGAKSVFLEVRESNWAARALYEKWAFVESGHRPRYYHSPEEDAVVYRHSFR